MTVLRVLFPFPALSRQRWSSGSGEVFLAAADEAEEVEGDLEGLDRGFGWGLVRPLSEKEEGEGMCMEDVDELEARYSRLVLLVGTTFSFFKILVFSGY